MCGVFRLPIMCKSGLAVVLVTAALSVAAQQPAPVPQPVELQLNTPISRKLAGGHADTFLVHCSAKDFLRVIADQKGIDVAVSILDPAGKSIVDADGPNGPQGPESASAICPVTGVYTVRVSSGDASVPAGDYVLHLDALRPPEPNDRLRIEAEQAAFAGAALFQGTKEEKIRATELFSKAVDDWSKIGDHYEAGLWGTTLGILWSNLSDTPQAIAVHSRALADERALNDRRAEAELLSDLGSSYLFEGDAKRALENYTLALPVQRELKDRVNEASTLNGIGQAYQQLGRIEEALDAFTRSLAIGREIGDISLQAQALNNMGLLYESLGEHPKALDFYLQTLAFDRQLQDRTFEATSLSNIGVQYDTLGEHEKGMDYLQQAVALSRKVGDRTGEGVDLNNIGAAYVTTHEYQKALDSYLQALVAERETQDRAHQALTLNNLGWLYGKLNDPSMKLSYELNGLAEATAVADPALIGSVNAELMFYFRDAHQPELAILFGISAVNSYQGIRKNIAGLDKNLRADFVQSKSFTYRSLAELLIQANRLAEAEQVLDLLKTAELSESVHGSLAAAVVSPLPLSSADQAVLSAIQHQATQAASLTADRIELARLRAIPTPVPAETQKLGELNTKISAANTALEIFFRGALTNLPSVPQNPSSTTTGNFSAALSTLGPGVIGIYTLVAKDRTYLIVTTAHGLSRRDVSAGAAALDKLIMPLRTALRSPGADAAPALAELHHLLLAPIAQDIAAAAKASPDRIPTLLWSLDGSLRYIPLNALYDGKHYFVETARNVVITPESQAHLSEASLPSAPHELAMGISRSYDGLPALSGVTAELDAVVKDPASPASHGPIPGRLLPNDAFTLAALESNLQQKFPIVHIASHFVFKPGDSGSSYLLLSGDQAGGAGYQLTLLKLDTDPQLSFQGTRLVTLSACSTAASDTGANGREMDSLGMVMQQRGAAAVLATLWDVNDASTARLMSDFYRRWANTPGISKVEALRQAQLAMLHGSAAISTAKPSTTGRGTTIESNAVGVTYAHPYFWAPFVLIGNFR